MDSKNVAILLIALFCIAGLALGVYYTETSDSAANPDDYEEVTYGDSNGTIVISLELKEKNESILDKFTRLS